MREQELIRAIREKDQLLGKAQSLLLDQQAQIDGLTEEVRLLRRIVAQQQAEIQALWEGKNG